MKFLGDQKCRAAGPGEYRSGEAGQPKGEGEGGIAPEVVPEGGQGLRH